MQFTLQMQVGDVIKEINGVNLDYKKPDEGGWGGSLFKHLDIMRTSCGHHVDIMRTSCGHHVDIM